MSGHAKTVLREALSLPEEERAEIAGALLESLEPAPEADVETEWRREVAARVAALDAGDVETIPWEDIRERYLARLRECLGSCCPVPRFSSPLGGRRLGQGGG
jgi:putative addiction module component (TIGR02574 family)